MPGGDDVVQDFGRTAAAAAGHDPAQEHLPVVRGAIGPAKVDDPQAKQLRHQPRQLFADGAALSLMRCDMFGGNPSPRLR